MLENDIIGLLRIEICQGRNLSVNSASNVYVQAEFFDGLPVHATESTKKQPAQWGSSFQSLIYKNESNFVLSLKVMDYNLLTSDDYLGRVEVSLGEVLQNPPSHFPFHSPDKVWLRVVDTRLVDAELCISAAWANFEAVEAWFWRQLVQYHTDATRLFNRLSEEFSADETLVSSSSSSALSPMNISHSSSPVSHLRSSGAHAMPPPLLNVESVRAILQYLKIELPNEEIANHLFDPQKPFTPISFERFVQFMKEREAEILRRGTNLRNMIWKTGLLTESTFNKIVIEKIAQYEKASPEKLRITQTIFDGYQNECNIYVQDRETGKVEKELIPQHIHMSIKMLYANSTGLALTQSQGNTLLVKLSQTQGEQASNPKSVEDIKGFIELHHLDLNLVQDPLDSFKSFNEFFYRKIKMDQRPINGDADVVVSPADCRLHVFENIDIARQIWIKGHGFTLKTLLENEELENAFAGCSLVIARLAPQDYHRFHFPISGRLGDFIAQGDSLFTVNPIAINSSIDVYSHNKRLSVAVTNERLGQMMYISIGATMVGSVVLTSQPGSLVQKGDEHGYFAFGGSTILLLFQRGIVQFDEDLLLNSQNSMETLVKVGSRIGRRRRDD